MSSRSGRAGEFANHIREFEGVRDFFTSTSITSMIDLLFIGIFLGSVVADRRSAGAGTVAGGAGRARS